MLQPGKDEESTTIDDTLISNNIVVLLKNSRLSFIKLYISITTKAKSCISSSHDGAIGAIGAILRPSYGNYVRTPHLSKNGNR